MDPTTPRAIQADPDRTALYHINATTHPLLHQLHHRIHHVADVGGLEERVPAVEERDDAEGRRGGGEPI